jgi:AraC-like DNA-binding protein
MHSSLQKLALLRYRDSVKQLSVLKQMAADMRLLVNHAVYGVHSGGAGSNRLPMNRLYYVLDGPDELGTLCFPNSAPVPLRPNTVYLIPKNITLSFAFTRGCELAAFHFRLELVPGFDLFDGVSDIREFRGLGANVERVVALCRNAGGLVESARIVAAVLETACAVSPYDEAAIHEILVRREKHRELFRLLSESAYAGATIEELAQRLGRHRDTVSRTFRHDFGVPLKSYMTQLLVQRAVDQILSTERHMYEIAGDLRFSSEFYFSRFIKKHTGLAPRDLRQSLSL